MSTRAAVTAIINSGPQADPKRAVLVGLVGRSIQLSRTPAMHEAEARAQGLACVYRLLDTDLMGESSPTLPTLVRFAEHFGFSGFNVTFPYKQEIMPLLDELSETARGIGSVNTVVLRDGARFGHNTDMWGFRESFRRSMSDVPRRLVLLIGAGGAGSAVAHALLECGVTKLAVADVRLERAEALVERLDGHFGAGRAYVAADPASVAAGADGIVNATPVGMAKMPGMPIAAEHVRSDHWIADVIYFPLETEFLKMARRKGCRTLAGEGMAVFQAVRAFELFTGASPDVDRMKATFAAFDG